MLGDLERLLSLDFAGLPEGEARRPRFGLGDLDLDLDPERPPLLAGDRLGGLLLRGGDLPPLYPLGDCPRLGGDLLHPPPPPPLRLL